MPTYTELVDADLAVQKPIRSASFGLRIADALRVLAALGGTLDLGGSDDVGVVLEGSPPDWTPARGVREYLLDGDDLAGLDLDAVVYIRSSPTSPAPEVQWRLRNTDDNTNAAIGDATTSIVRERQIETVTLASGQKWYRLEVIGADGGESPFCYGYLRIRKVPA
jgi:hypothetical protein